MKKAILVFGMVVTGLGIKAQTIEVVTKKNLYEDGDVSLTQEGPQKFYFIFTNDKYQYLTDIGIVGFYTTSDLKTFVTLINQMLDNPNPELIVKGKGYTLNKYDFDPGMVYVTDKDGAYERIGKSRAGYLKEAISKL